MNNITAIIVSYNTRDLLRNCVESIRKFYPILKIIIIDGSPTDSDCWQYCQTLHNNDMHATVRCLEYNCGHGPGMVKGIELCETDYFLLCDSDVEIKENGFLGEMLSVYLRLENCYGMGMIVETNDTGGNVPTKITIEKGKVFLSKPGSIQYLHPHFALIKKEIYLKYHSVINHGAPMIKAMVDLQKRQEDFLFYWPINEYVLHHERGTRALNPKEFNPANWDKV